MVEKEDSSWDQLVASLDPPIADRISSVFPDVDPKVLQTVSTLFTEQLTGYMLDFLDGTEPLEVSKIPLFPLLLEKTAGILGIEPVNPKEEQLNTDSFWLKQLKML